MDINSSSVVFNATTPASFKLKRGSGYFKAGKYDFIFNANGHKITSVRLEAHLNSGWYVVGNIFIGGIIGWLIIDHITGSMWTFSDNNVVNASLDENSSYKFKSGDLKVVLFSDPFIQDFREHLVRIN